MTFRLNSAEYTGEQARKLLILHNEAILRQFLLKSLQHLIKGVGLIVLF